MAKKTGSASGATIAALRKAALRHANVKQTVACEGTAIESTSYTVNGKAFLFLRPRAAMLKLGKSRDEAVTLATESPATYKVGNGGWTTVAEPGKAPLTLMQKWIAESYALFANGSSKKSPGVQSRRRTKAAS